MSRRLVAARWRAALVALLLGFVLVAFGVASAAADPFPSITDSGYDPAVVKIHAGETITWINRGTQAHSVTATDGSFDSGPIAPGNRWANTFTEVGTFNVGSTSDGSFHGQVVVLGIDVTTAPATAALSPAPTPVVPTGSKADPGPTDAGPLMAVAIVGSALIIAGAVAVATRRSTPGRRSGTSRRR